MPTIEVKVEIAQPPETVAEAFLDPTNAVFWTTGLDRFEVISRKPGDVGSVAHLHYRERGHTYVMEDVLLEIIPNQYFKSRVSGNGLVAVVETWLREIKKGTEVKINWSGSASSIRMRIMLFLMKGAMIRQTRAELDKFKSLVETHGAHFSD